MGNNFIQNLRQKLANKIAPPTQRIKTTTLFNRWGSSIIGDLDPISLSAILEEAESGNITRYQALGSKMMRTDAHVFGCYNSRINSAAKREHELLSASDENFDKERAADTARMIDNIENFYLFKKEAYDAIPKSFSTHWIEWFVDGKDLGIRRFHQVNQHNFRWGIANDPKSDMNQLRRLTDDAMLNGVELEKNKWFVPIIKANSGLPATAGLMHVNVWMYLFKNFDIKSWLQFAERYYLPTRIGKYDPATATSDDQDALMDALESLGQDASAIISKNTAIEFIEEANKAATAQVHEGLAVYCDKQNSKAILGHTGAIDSTEGKLGGEDAAMEARFDLIESDCMQFDYYMNDIVIKSYETFKWGPQKRYSQFKSKVIPPKDRKYELDIMNNFQAPISETHYYQSAGVPMPKEGEKIIVPKQQIANPFANPFAAKDTAESGKKKV